MQEQFGRYILLERVAIGGMAEIFKAKAPGLGGFEKILAIKRLHPRYSEDADFIEMLIDEARISVELSHSNIAQIFDLGKVEDHYFIAMEFIDGRDLYRCQKRLRDRRTQFPIEAATYIAAEACAGLDFAHRKKDARGRPLTIIHRDVSPQNVLVSFEGEVKLVDFGIAKAALRAYETESGIIKGKFYYMSPEQARGEPLDHRTDVFSLGIVLYEMLTGDLLYKDDDDASLLSRVRKADIAPPSTLRPDIPRALDNIVMKALAREREDRYLSALHLQKDLNKFLRSIGGAFGRVRLARLMRETFLDEAHIEDSEELDAFMLRSRAEFGNDRHSMIRDGLDTTFDAGDSTHDITAANDRDEVDAALEAESIKSELIVLESAEVRLDDDSFDAMPATADLGTPEPPRDLDYDPFDEESTGAMDNRPAVHAPPADLDDLPDHLDEPSVRVAPVVASRAPDLKPVARAGRPSPDAVAFAAAPTPVPDRPAPRAQPTADRPGRARGDAPAGRPRKEVATDPGRDAPQPSIHRPVRPRRVGQEQPTTMGQPVVTAQALWLTRERALFGGVILLVLVLAAVLTSIVIRPSTDKQRLEPATVTVGAQPQGEMATLLVKSFPSGAKVRVGAEWLPETTPTTHSVPVGRPTRVTVRLGDDYAEFEQEVVPLAGQEVTVNAQLEKMRGVLTVESQPADASIFLDGQPVGRTPATLRDLPMDRPARLRVLREGYDPEERAVEWGGKREQVVDLRMRASGSAEAGAGLPSLEPERVAVRAAPRRVEPERRVAPERRAEPSRPQRRVIEDEPPLRRAEPPEPPPPPTGRRAGMGGKGFLSVSSRRWGAVYVDGRLVQGETPLVKYAVDAGMHSVQVYFEGNASDRSERKNVVVERGETTLVKF